MKAPFFLHVHPSDPPLDIPANLRLLQSRFPNRGRAQRPPAFDNLDFTFHDRGALLDEKCVAVVTLPDYEIARIRTGQFLPVAGELWSVELPGN